jgi:hypothetical protein
MAVRWFWSTPIRKGLAIGLFVGCLVAVAVPGIGLATGGDAYSIRGWVMLAVAIAASLLGGWIGSRFTSKSTHNP